MQRIPLADRKINVVVFQETDEMQKIDFKNKTQSRFLEHAMRKNLFENLMTTGKINWGKKKGKNSDDDG